MQNYADSVESIRDRNRKIDAMAEVIRKHVPKLDAKYLDPNVNTLDRQIGHSEVLLGALISGLTNVVAFTVDELGHRYTGIPGIEGEKVNMHDVGHNKSIGGLSAETIRERARRITWRLLIASSNDSRVCPRVMARCRQHHALLFPGRRGDASQSRLGVSFHYSLGR